MEEQAQVNQAPEIKSSPYQSPMHQYGSSILYLTNPNNEIQKLELTLRGKKLDDEGNIVVTGDPLLNRQGVSLIMGEAQPIINQITVMSSLNKQEILSLFEELADTTIKNLMRNRVCWKIQSESARDVILFNIIATGYICMKRAHDVSLNDKKFWRGSVQEIHSRVEGAKEKKSLFSKLNPWNN